MPNISVSAQQQVFSTVQNFLSSTRVTELTSPLNATTVSVDSNVVGTYTVATIVNRQDLSAGHLSDFELKTMGLGF